MVDAEETNNSEDSLISASLEGSQGMHYRAEALKMAYEVGLKINFLTPSQTPEKRYEALEGIFALGKLNYDFIKEGKIPA